MLNNIKYTSQKGQDKWVIEDIFKGKNIPKSKFSNLKLKNSVFSNPISLIIPQRP